MGDDVLAARLTRVSLLWLALYRVSTPSGIMTMSEVPTRTPIPIVEMNRNWEGFRENERGNSPARNELDGQ